MGHGNFVFCEGCGYEREVMLGSGMMYFGLDQTIQFLDKKTMKKYQRFYRKILTLIINQMVIVFINVGNVFL